MENGLSKFSTEELAAELVLRKDLVKENGLVSPPVYELRKRFPICTVDSLAVRKRDDGKTEVMAIVRNTGPYKGRWCSVGGTVGLNESVEKALMRHWRDDLGLTVKIVTFPGIDGSWQHPFCLNQHRPPTPATIDGVSSDDFYPEPTKHSIAPFYAVEITGGTITFGSTAYGQEASDIAWFCLEDLSEPETFAYGFHKSYHDYLTKAAEEK